MKYRQIDTLENEWKRQYLVNKLKNGEQVTRHEADSDADREALEMLSSLEEESELINSWIKSHISSEVTNKLKQAIRAKRKRHFNAEQIHTKKKSIDIDYRVWEKLSIRANELGCTLSDAIEYLLSEASRTEKASKAVSHLKEDLSRLLGE